MFSFTNTILNRIFNKYRIMKNESLTINEKGLNLKDTKSILLSCIDAAINGYKLNHLSGWMKNHEVAKLEEDENFVKLIEMKDAFDKLYAEYDAIESEVQLNISFDLLVEGQKKKDKLQEEAMKNH